MNENVRWRATTEHGTTYTYDGFSIFIDSERHGAYRIRPMGGIRIIDREHLRSLDSNEKMWEEIRNAEWAELPVIGKAIYIHSFSEWRLSTEVVSLEILEDEDVNSSRDS